MKKYLKKKIYILFIFKILRKKIFFFIINATESETLIAFFQRIKFNSSPRG